VSKLVESYKAVEIRFFEISVLVEGSRANSEGVLSLDGAFLVVSHLATLNDKSCIAVATAATTSSFVSLAAQDIPLSVLGELEVHGTLEPCLD
jgi:hypothetical protein